MVFSFLWMGIWCNLFDFTLIPVHAKFFFILTCFWLSYEITTRSILLVCCDFHLNIWISSTSGSPQKQKKNKTKQTKTKWDMMNVCDGDRLSFVFLWSTSRRGIREMSTRLVSFDGLYSNFTTTATPRLARATSFSLFDGWHQKLGLARNIIKHGDRTEDFNLFLFFYQLLLNIFWESCRDGTPF